jgi:glutamate-ammonia-ligase adenylyltransferase
VRATLQALSALREAQLLPEAEADVLRRAYLFLRDVENKLQMVADAQVHALPRSTEELRLLARRLGYRDAPDASAEDALRRAHRSHTEAVHAIFGETFARLERA